MNHCIFGGGNRRSTGRVVRICNSSLVKNAVAGRLGNLPPVAAFHLRSVKEIIWKMALGVKVNLDERT
jgi:hypothetical protein